jgi:hypothetical protein
LVSKILTLIGAFVERVNQKEQSEREFKSNIGPGIGKSEDLFYRSFVYILGKKYDLLYVLNIYRTKTCVVHIVRTVKN